MTKYIFRIDDVSENMHWDNFNRLIEICNVYKIRPLIAVVPENKNKDLLKFPKCKFNFFNFIKDLQNLGWKVAMHGLNHVYYTKRKGDLLSIGGETEFTGRSLEEQTKMIAKGLKIFNDNSIAIDTFIAPNHHFDFNTIKALKKNNITKVSDGYGFYPFENSGLVFVPQLFGKLISFPFGILTSCHHINNFTNKDFELILNFIKTHHTQFIDFDEATNYRKNFVNFLFSNTLKYGLITKRFFIK